MIAFSPDGFFSAGMVMIFWGITDKQPWYVIVGGVMIVVALLWPKFFEQFNRRKPDPPG